MYKKVSACVYNYSKLARDMNGEWSMVLINGRDLTVEEVIRVCRNDEEVKLTDEAEKNVQKARDYIEKKLAEKAVIYGLTTGFGKFSNVLS